MLDFRLKVFHRVANHLSFTKASKELFISQPAITKHIQELESEFEVKLFNRIGNKVTLTAAGTLLLTYAENISVLHNEMKFALSRLKEKFEGTLRLGASTTISQYVIPSCLANFHEHYPDISLSLDSGNTEVIEKLLLTNKIDFGIVEGEPTHADLRYTPFLDDELIVFTSPKNKKKLRLTSKQDFIKLPLVLRERGSGTLEIIEKTLKKNQINPAMLHPILYLGSTEAIKTYIKTGTGVGIVSKYALEQEFAAGNLIQLSLPELVFYRKFYFVSPKGPDLSGLSKLFFQFTQKHYNL